jgi:hypothetical protein
MGYDGRNPPLYFKLDITDNTTICAEITFNPDTLVITSRTVFESDDPNHSVITDAVTGPPPGGSGPPAAPAQGTFIFVIGYAQIGYDAEGIPEIVYTQNNFVGNINFEFVYGAFNGVPAILPVAVFPLSTASGTSFVAVGTPTGPTGPSGP